MTTTPRLRKGASKPKAAKPCVMTAADKARMAVTPSINGASVIQAYQGNVMGKDADMSVLVDQLRDTFTEVKGGDLHTLEAMLISQAKPRRCKPFSQAWQGVQVRRSTCPSIKRFWGLP